MGCTQRNFSKKKLDLARWWVYGGTASIDKIDKYVILVISQSITRLLLILLSNLFISLNYENPGLNSISVPTIRLSGGLMLLGSDFYQSVAETLTTCT